MSELEQRIDALIELNRFEQAETLALQGLASDPEDAGLVVSLAEIYRLQDREVKALETAKKALSLDPDRVDAFYIAALCTAVVGEPDLALSYADEAIRLFPNAHSFRTRGTVCVFLSDRAKGRKETKRLAELAVDSFTTALEEDPGDAQALVRLSHAHLILKQFDHVELYAKRALSVDPSLASAVSFLGRVEEDAGNHTEAFELYDVALKTNPSLGFSNLRILVMIAFAWNWYLFWSMTAVAAALGFATYRFAGQWPAAGASAGPIAVAVLAPKFGMWRKSPKAFRRGLVAVLSELLSAIAPLLMFGVPILIVAVWVLLTAGVLHAVGVFLGAWFLSSFGSGIVEWRRWPKGYRDPLASVAKEAVPAGCLPALAVMLVPTVGVYEAYRRWGLWAGLGYLLGIFVLGLLVSDFSEWRNLPKDERGSYLTYSDTGQGLVLNLLFVVANVTIAAWVYLIAGFWFAVAASIGTVFLSSAAIEYVTWRVTSRELREPFTGVLQQAFPLGSLLFVTPVIAAAISARWAFLQWGFWTVPGLVIGALAIFVSTVDFSVWRPKPRLERGSFIDYSSSDDNEYGQRLNLGAMFILANVTCTAWLLPRAGFWAATAMLAGPIVVSSIATRLVVLWRMPKGERESFISTDEHKSDAVTLLVFLLIGMAILRSLS